MRSDSWFLLWSQLVAIYQKVIACVLSEIKKKKEKLLRLFVSPSFLFFPSFKNILNLCILLRQSHCLAHTGLVLLAILLPQPSKVCATVCFRLAVSEGEVSGFFVSPEDWDCSVPVSLRLPGEPCALLCFHVFAGASGPVLGIS